MTMIVRQDKLSNSAVSMYICKYVSMYIFKYVHTLARKQNNAITNKKKTRRLVDDNSGS